MTDIDTKELRRLMEEATPGPVKWWTSNSWRRLRRDDRGIAQSIAEPYVARDGHPDLAIKQADMDFIAALWNSAPALLSEAEEAARLREELAALRAAPPAPVADGWVMVPREPTRALTQAWQVAEDDSWALQPDEDDPHVHGAAGYRAMLAAAPTEAGR